MELGTMEVARCHQLAKVDDASGTTIL
uniref:Uncharacterized protein n=1 Tax=Arundo donax TaxID=35708 RepID=A0A0A9AK65_ARUDO